MRKRSLFLAAMLALAGVVAAPAVVVVAHAIDVPNLALEPVAMDPGVNPFWTQPIGAPVKLASAQLIASAFETPAPILVSDEPLMLQPVMLQPISDAEAAKLPKLQPMEDTVVAPPTPADWASFWTSLGGWKGAGALGLTAVIVQGLLLLARSSFDPLPGATKLLVVTGLTLASGALVLKQTGLDWASVLMHASTLSAAQVFVHQVVSEVKALMAPKPVAVVAALAPAPTETKSAS